MLVGTLGDFVSSQTFSAAAMRFESATADEARSQHRAFGCPAAQSERSKPWETKERQASPSAAGSGISIKCSEEVDLDAWADEHNPSSRALAPRLVRLRDAPRYLGMDKNRFNREVRPCLVVIPIGTQGDR